MKTYSACPPDKAPPGYGGYVQFDGNEYDLPGNIRRALQLLSCWGGNTSNSPDEYSHWEFTPRKYPLAIVFLQHHGYKEK